MYVSGWENLRVLCTVEFGLENRILKQKSTVSISLLSEQLGCKQVKIKVDIPWVSSPGSSSSSDDH